MTVTLSGQPITQDELQDALIAQAPELMRFVSSRIPPRLQAVVAPEDVLQEVWISAFQSMRSFRQDGPDSLSRWLTSLTQRQLLLIIQHGTRLKRGGAATIRQGQGRLSQSYTALFEQLCSGTRTPSREISIIESATAVQVALARLPDDQREVVTQRHLRGRSCEDIAASMSKSKAAVHSLLFRGLRQLQDLLSGPGTPFSGIRAADTLVPTNSEDEGPAL